MLHLGISMRLALAVLATWRITHLLVSEDGPGDVIFHLRAKLGSSFAGKLMDCFYCLSLWVSAATATVVTQHLSDWVLVWLALSGGACLLEQATRERTLTYGDTRQGESNYALLRTEESEPAEHCFENSEREQFAGSAHP